MRGATAGACRAATARRRVRNLLCAGGLLASGVDAQSNFTAHVAAVSDYVFRGVSQSTEDPVLQVGVDFEHSAGWFAGAWASGVDFPSNVERESPRDLEIDLYAGYAFELAPQWALSVQWTRYEYPGSAFEHDYDYDEWSVALRRGAVSVTAARSDNALGLNGDGLSFEVAGRWRLGRAHALTAGLGDYRLDLPFTDGYAYGHVALERTLGRATMSVGVYGTDSDGERTFGDLAGERIVAGVRWRLF